MTNKCRIRVNFPVLLITGLCLPQRMNREKMNAAIPEKLITPCYVHCHGDSVEDVQNTKSNQS